MDWTARPQAQAGRIRALALLVLLCGGGVLGIAAWLRPSPTGLGTHQQLFPGPCGMLIRTGLPCPTCGMTTAFANTVRGRFWAAFIAQPTGLILCLATMAACGAALLALWRGRWPTLRVRYLSPDRVFLALLILLIAGWAFKIALGLCDGTFPYR